MSWEWEYDPSEEYLVGGADPGFVAQVEARADELARAAAALYLEGSAYQGRTPRARQLTYQVACSSTSSS